MAQYGPGMSEASFNAMIARGADGSCHYCGCVLSHTNSVKEHTLPKSRGGKQGNNLVLACTRCDHFKGPLTEFEYLAVRHDEHLRKALITLVLEARECGSDIAARRALLLGLADETRQGTLVLTAARVTKIVGGSLTQTIGEHWPDDGDNTECVTV